MKKKYIFLSLLTLITSCSLMIMPAVRTSLGIDTKPPVLKILSLTNNQEVGAIYTLSGTAADNKSGTTAVYVRTDDGDFKSANLSGDNWYINISLGNYGYHTNYLYATDKANNVTATNMLRVFRAFLPSIIVTNMYSGILTNFSNITIAGRVSMDSPYTVSSMAISLNGSLYSPVDINGSNWSTNLSLIEDTNLIDIMAIGDNGRSNSINNFVIILDTLPPLINVLSPTNNEVVETNYTINGEVSDTYGIKKLYLKSDNGAFSEVALNGSQWSTNLIVNGGFHTNYIYAEDNAGNISTTNQLIVVHYNPGSIDPSFVSAIPTTNPSNTVYCIALQQDGKILVGGNISNGILRLNPDGSLDTTFDTGTGANGFIYSIYVQHDEQILIGGKFTTFNGVNLTRIARLNTNGTVDTSFDPGSGANNTVYAITAQPDGRILIGGAFDNYNGTTRNAIARINLDGSLDSSFNPATGTGVNCLLLRNDGNIIAGGHFMTPYTYSNIVILNNNGTVDTSFAPDSGPNNRVWALGLQSDNKIIIGGLFTAYNGTNNRFVSRINPDGSLDTGFSRNADKVIHTITVQNDDKVLMGGEFSTYDSTNIMYFTRLNADGSIDTDFNTGSGPNDFVYGTAIQSNGMILIGGSFKSYNGKTANYIARIYN